MIDESTDMTKTDAGPPPRRRWSKGKWAAIALAVVALLLALGVAGIAYATYDYAAEYKGRILPGTVIQGVDVGGLTESQALEVVRASVAPRLDRRIRVTFEGRRWVVTPRSLGARSNARRVVRAALAASASTSFMDKMRMKVLGDEMGFERSVAIDHPRAGVRDFVDELAAKLRVEPRDAQLDYSTGWVEIVPERRGREVRVDDARRALGRALRRGDGHVAVPVESLRPDVTRAAYDSVLLVRIGENRLYLYRDGRIAHSWPVATGQPEYMTPTGVYEVTEKRYMPTWINPAPTTWGKDLPAEIPPGPGNPLGVRAINWSAPAIRFHGTEATYSLGYNASHGCVRLSNEDVVELYDMVEVGTPIVSLVAGPLDPLYVSSPDPTPVAGDSGGGNG
jgi:lipoprotein-anchoring transpeptidase ErfK/SrfK